MKRLSVPLILLVLASCCSSAAQKPLPEQAAEAMARAARFFHREVAVHGSYLWSYSEDLKTRAGERVVREVTSTQGWVEPPGTPSVGMAYLAAYGATADPAYLEAARDAARALAETQLESGGWEAVIEFDPVERRQWYYRTDREKGDNDPGTRRNTTTYDDNASQSALQLLMRVDATLKEKDPEIHRAAEYGLRKLLEAQYPNGAWPQRWDGKPRDPKDYPVLKAHYPQRWSRTWPDRNFRGCYTFNDNTIPDVIATLREAHRTYGRKAYRDAALRGGNFILLAQLPEPQPVWAQQYNAQMEPAWARKFEPPSVCTTESVGVIRALIGLCLDTSDEQWLKPVPPALDWFRRSRLPDERWARFYELKTNRPLYFTMQYELVYTDNDLPTHYSFQGDYGVPGVTRLYEEVRREGAARYATARRQPRTPDQLRSAAAAMEPRVREILAALDSRGRWVANGTIECETFNRNLETLAEFVATARSRELKREPELSHRVSGPDIGP